MGKFVIKKSKEQFMFNLFASNGEIIATSERYSSLDAAQNGVESVRSIAAAANLEDQTVEGFEELTHPKFEVYADKAGEPRFRLKAINGEIVAVSEGYSSKQACLNGVASVRKNAPDAKVEIEE